MPDFDEYTSVIPSKAFFRSLGLVTYALYARQHSNWAFSSTEINIYKSLDACKQLLIKSQKSITLSSYSIYPRFTNYTMALRHLKTHPCSVRVQSMKCPYRWCRFHNHKLPYPTSTNEFTVNMNWLSALDSPVYQSRNRASANAIPRTRAGVLQAGAGSGADEGCAAVGI